MSDARTQLSGPPQASRWKRNSVVFLQLGAVIAALLLAYSFGRWQTAVRIDVVEARLATAEKSVQNERRALLSERQNSQRLEARRQLHLALLSLDERNFGTAEQRVASAVALLRDATPGHPLAELVKPLSEYRLRATEDLGEQRQQLLQSVKRFDALLAAAP